MRLPVHATVLLLRTPNDIKKQMLFTTPGLLSLTRSSQTQITNSTVYSPARFYVSVVVKMVLPRLIVDYEIKLADPKGWPIITSCNVRLPSPFKTIPARKRTVCDDGESDQASL